MNYLCSGSSLLQTTDGNLRERIEPRERLQAARGAAGRPELARWLRTFAALSTHVPVFQLVSSPWNGPRRILWWTDVICLSSHASVNLPIKSKPISAPPSYPITHLHSEDDVLASGPTRPDLRVDFTAIHGFLHDIVTASKILPQAGHQALAVRNDILLIPILISLRHNPAGQRLDGTKRRLSNTIADTDPPQYFPSPYDCKYALHDAESVLSDVGSRAIPLSRSGRSLRTTPLPAGPYFRREPSLSDMHLALCHRTLVNYRMLQNRAFSLTTQEGLPHCGVQSPATPGGTPMQSRICRGALGERDLDVAPVLSAQTAG
ncbi:hypothetical protein NM688_g2655 [Phlebia brevispora]|uniref:Uncharacterized protein n=1 Tax=Phlebia brevispora TaxID=194682 RepID=A0ACC1T7V7_9APHY|nr:hypothetical protein NM688_g2655 [Phlebia brevispora]